MLFMQANIPTISVSYIISSLLQLMALKLYFLIFQSFVKIRRNRHKSFFSTAHISIAYDIINDFIIDVDFSSLTVSERTHSKNYMEKVTEIIDLKDALFIMDIGYVSKKSIRLFSEKSNYLFHIRTKFSVEIDKL